MENLLSIIGPARCGSTWLHNSLRAHSRFRCAAGRVKEVAYFDTKYQGPLASEPLGVDQAGSYAASKRQQAEKMRSRIEEIDQRLATIVNRHAPAVRRLSEERHLLSVFADGYASGGDWYRRQFHIDSAGLWALDSSPAYCLMAQDGFADLLGTADRVICVLLTRNAKSMLRSKLQHYAHRPSMTSPIISAEKQLDLLDFFARSYTLGVTQALDFIPRDQLRRVAFEDLTERPQQVVTDLLASLGLQPEAGCWSQIGVSPNPSRPIDIAPEAEDLLAILADRLDHETQGLLESRDR